MTHIAASATPVVTDVAAPARAPSWLRLGILFGLVSAASILLWGPIGVSGTYSRFVGWLGQFVAPTFIASNPYVIKMGSVLKPETFLVIGLAIGGFLAARLSHDRAPASEFVHARETSTKRRYVDAFLGGLLIIFGARLAGGCTSGHIISGITQLSLSGMIFGAATFASGIITAKSIRRATEG
jgi:uncharacterized membrane protein YedE/YeeE